MSSQLGTPNIGYAYFSFFLFSLIMCENTPLFGLISREVLIILKVFLLRKNLVSLT